MASDSSPGRNNNGPSSPDEFASSPIGNTYSSPATRTRRRRRSTTPLPYNTPPTNQSRFATSESTPTTTPNRTRHHVSTPSSDGGPPLSSDAGDDIDEATPDVLFGGRISVCRIVKGVEIYEEGKYMKGIHEVLEMEGEWLDVDAHDVFDYDVELYGKMVRYPLEPLFEKHVQVRIFNLKSSTTMRNLNPSDIEKMLSLKGMIIRCSSIIPEIREAVFKCIVCGYLSDLLLWTEQECLAKNSMSLVHNRCRFAEKQIVRLQETPDEIPDGGTPHTVSLLMHDKLVDAGKPGDRIEAMSVRVGPTQRTVKSLFKTYVDCLHIKKTDKSRMLAEDPMEVDNGNASRRIEEDFHFDEAKIEQLKKLSRLPDIYDRLTRSLAPNIWELDDVKRASVVIYNPACGDPGTRKSQLLQYIHKLSSVASTPVEGKLCCWFDCYVSKDTETGETVLESGSIVLSDRGICCIE
ncbi:hypothetical protein NC652_023849 [Populus alba x Populus x berolinensis]|nr:hypothetical protein NC652_023849 [Populus alba x Populus x berolinensis]